MHEDTTLKEMREPEAYNVALLTDSTNPSQLSPFCLLDVRERLLKLHLERGREMQFEEGDLQHTI